VERALFTQCNGIQLNLSVAARLHPDLSNRVFGNVCT
jgi:hypothetical protein